MTDWSELYRPQLGQTLVGIVWMPIAADTPQLVSELGAPSFSFSGGVHLRFEGAPAINLTWTWKGDRYFLAIQQTASWALHSLDRFRASGDQPWSGLDRAIVQSVEFFTLPDDPERRVVGIRHQTTGGYFWIGTGGRDFIGDCDDLWVGVDCDPPNRTDLIRIGAVG